MVNKQRTSAVLAALVLISLCACQYSTQTRYNYSEVGQVQVVQFGTVVAVRDIDIYGENSGATALAGAAGGAALGAGTGNGFSSVAGGVAGAAAGAALGSGLEQAIRRRGGVEYTVVLQNGKTITVAQNVSEKDTILEINDRVMVQINGQYQRVLPANNLPEEIEKPKGIKLK
ncbi:hypothetical protein [Desulfovibrio sp. Huiquan2017]|uniref:hypothetical protein n=1 Tax=Desulfovibrio sp. Huiquan2017 TaxID=2816861 RepID=UPI001A90D683|nr:hypothetical protein [Desulfovibrio sp. Huiquan2017]